MIKACVIGWPIAHSRSPLIHNYWLRQNAIAGLYERIAVSPEDLKSFLQNLKNSPYVGCNVTIPHKQLALPAIDHLDESVIAIGAVNTVYVRNGKTYATSTDGEGFFQNLCTSHPSFDPSHKKITVLGAGGSAKAIIERLLRADVSEIALINRTSERADELKSQFGSRIKVTAPNQLHNELRTTDVLINTTSQGMVGQPELQIDLSALPKQSIVADIVYVPLKTQLIRQAENLGLRTVPGLGMLLHQAVVGFELWFGIKPKVTKEIYNIVAVDIDPDYKP